MCLCDYVCICKKGFTLVQIYGQNEHMFFFLFPSQWLEIFSYELRDERKKAPTKCWTLWYFVLVRPPYVLCVYFFYFLCSLSLDARALFYLLLHMLIWVLIFRLLKTNICVQVSAFNSFHCILHPFVFFSLSLSISSLLSSPIHIWIFKQNNISNNGAPENYLSGWQNVNGKKTKLNFYSLW